LPVQPEKAAFHHSILACLGCLFRAQQRKSTARGIAYAGLIQYAVPGFSAPHYALAGAVRIPDGRNHARAGRARGCFACRGVSREKAPPRGLRFAQICAKRAPVLACVFQFSCAGNN